MVLRKWGRNTVLDILRDTLIKFRIAGHVSSRKARESFSRTAYSEHDRCELCELDNCGG
jgi:hypothetical protein